MARITTGSKVPDVDLHMTADKRGRLSGFSGKIVVLYFYPRANTPGCTQEGLDFKAAINKFRRQSTVILGASRDSLKAQENFKVRQEFPFELISDPDEELCKLFDVIKLKNMYGKQVYGIERSTFLIDAEGVLRQEWRKVKVPGHVDEVLEAVKALRKEG